MTGYYFENNQTKRRYEIVHFDEEHGKVRIKGESGNEFDEKLDRAAFEQMGYVLKQA